MKTVPRRKVAEEIADLQRTACEFPDVEVEKLFQLMRVVPERQQRGQQRSGTGPGQSYDTAPYRRLLQKLLQPTNTQQYTIRVTTRNV